MVCSTILFFLPVSTGIYAFRTDARTDTFPNVRTAIGTDNVSKVLLKPIYDNDTATISISSNLSTDVPIYGGSYNTTSRLLLIDGLSDNATHSLEVTYDVAAFTEANLTTFLDYIPFIWVLMVIAFPVAGLAAIWLGRA